MRYFFLLLLMALFSCKESSSECNNEKEVFFTKNFKEIDLDLNSNYDNVKQQIQSQANKDLCGIELLFSKDYKQEIIKLPFKSFDCQHIHITIHPNMITYLFNEKGEFLVESQLVDTKNLKNFIKESIINKRSNRQSETFYISFQLKSKIDEPIFNTVFEKTLDGIYSYYEDLSIKEFNKDFCDLSSFEIEELTSKFRFAFTSYEYPMLNFKN